MMLLLRAPAVPRAHMRSLRFVNCLARPAGSTASHGRISHRRESLWSPSASIASSTKLSSPSSKSSHRGGEEPVGPYSSSKAGRQQTLANHAAPGPHEDHLAGPAAKLGLILSESEAGSAAASAGVGGGALGGSREGKATDARHHSARAVLEDTAAAEPSEMLDVRAEAMVQGDRRGGGAAASVARVRTYQSSSARRGADQAAHRGVGAIDEGVDGLREAGYLDDATARDLAAGGSVRGSSLAAHRDCPDGGTSNVFAINEEYKEIAFKILNKTEQDHASPEPSVQDAAASVEADSIAASFTDTVAEMPGSQVSSTLPGGARASGHEIEAALATTAAFAAAAAAEQDHRGRAAGSRAPPPTGSAHPAAQGHRRSASPAPPISPPSQQSTHHPQAAPAPPVQQKHQQRRKSAGMLCMPRGPLLRRQDAAQWRP